MKTLDLVQGTPEWHTHRATSRNASEATAMLGKSEYKSREKLLRERYTGQKEEVSSYTQELFDRGHISEELARPNVCKSIGEDLFRATGTGDDDYLSASFDGINIDETFFWENKLFNKKVAAYIEANQDLPDTHWPQVEQQFMVSGATDCLFTLCDDNGEIKVSLRYKSVAARRAEVLEGWKLFDEDLAKYELKDLVVESAVAKPVLSLPDVSVKVEGEIKVITNFAAFEVKLKDFIENRLIKEPKTDQDFLDLDAQIKTLKNAEDSLVRAEAQMIAQVEPIEMQKRLKDMLYKLARDHRLVSEKLFKTEKENRKSAIIEAGKVAYDEHIKKLNGRLGNAYMSSVGADFAGAAKGLSSITSITEKVDKELVRMKLASNDLFDRIETNLKSLRDMANDYKFLFMDAREIVFKQNDDLVNLIKSRIAEHKAEEEKKQAALREQIRLEEEKKAQEKVRLEEEEKARARLAEEQKANQKKQEQNQPVAPGPVASSPAHHSAGFKAELSPKIDLAPTIADELKKEETDGSVMTKKPTVTVRAFVDQSNADEELKFESDEDVILVLATVFHVKSIEVVHRLSVMDFQKLAEMFGSRRVG